MGPARVDEPGEEQTRDDLEVHDVEREPVGQQPCASCWPSDTDKERKRLGDCNVLLARPVSVATGWAPRSIARWAHRASRHGRCAGRVAFATRCASSFRNMATQVAVAVIGVAPGGHAYKAAPHAALSMPREGLRCRQPGRTTERAASPRPCRRSDLAPGLSRAPAVGGAPGVNNVTVVTVGRL